MTEAFRESLAEEVAAVFRVRLGVDEWAWGHAYSTVPYELDRVVPPNKAVPDLDDREALYRAAL